MIYLLSWSSIIRYTARNWCSWLTHDVWYPAPIPRSLFSSHSRTMSKQPSEAQLFANAGAANFDNLYTVIFDCVLLGMTSVILEDVALTWLILIGFNTCAFAIALHILLWATSYLSLYAPCTSLQHLFNAIFKFQEEIRSKPRKYNHNLSHCRFIHFWNPCLCFVYWKFFHHPQVRFDSDPSWRPCCAGNGRRLAIDTCCILGYQ